MSAPPEAPRRPRLALGAATLGGALAWFAHLLAAYAIAEFGCVAGLQYLRFADVSLVSWLLFAATAVALAAALASAALAWRRVGAGHGLDAPDPRGFLARLGLALDLVFAAAIAYETVPVFYYLQGC